MNDLEGIGIHDDRRRRVLRKIACCGTGLLGWLQSECKSCGAREWSGRRCQDRHCPGCGRSSAYEWVENRKAELLDVPYFHVVFTVPSELYPIIEENQSVTYSAYMTAVKETLFEFCGSKTWMGGTPAVMAVLHTSNRQLGYHPHVHAAVAGAGWNEAGGCLALPRNPGFLAPIRRMATWFRGAFIAHLGGLMKKGKLSFSWKSTSAYSKGDSFNQLLNRLKEVEWNAHVERTFGDPLAVVKYLGRYTHQTAISNSRIASYTTDGVTYTWTESKTGTHRSKTVPASQFVKMFSRHILPKGFRRIRRWGLLSSKKAKTLLPLVAAALAKAAAPGRVARSLELAAEAGTAGQATCSECGSAELHWYGLEARVDVPMRIPTVLAQPPPGSRPSGAA